MMRMILVLSFIRLFPEVSRVGKVGKVGKVESRVKGGDQDQQL